jgi:Bacterial Ig domain
MNNWKKVLVSSVIATSFVTYTVGSAHAETKGRTVVKDTKAPGIPVITSNKSINKINQKNFEVKGKAEAKSKLVGTLKSKETQLNFTVKTDAKGNFKTSLNTLKFKDGTLSLSVYAIDESGNKGKVKTESVLKDTFLEELTVENEGYINSFNAEEFPVSGTGEPKATILVTLQSGKQTISGKTFVDELGNYSLNVNTKKFTEGKVTILVQQLDKAGNSSKVNVNLMKETKAPAKPLLFPASNVTAATDQTTYSISGLGKAGSEIEVVLSDGTIEVSSIGEVDEKGNFTVELDTTDLQSGEITVSAIQTSSAGNFSPESVTKFVKDLVAPNAPEVNALETIKTDNLSNYTVSGKGDVGSTINVYVTDGKTTKSTFGKVNEDGTFTLSINLTDLQIGNIFVIVSQADHSHNSSSLVTLTTQKVN